MVNIWLVLITDNKMRFIRFFCPNEVDTSTIS